MTAVAAPTADPFDRVRRIAVLRGGGLGDLVFVLPAVRALRSTYPDAEIVLLGTPAHAELLAGRPGPIDRVAALPVATGVHEPAGVPPDDRACDEFFRWGRRQRFDLAVQAHGGGRWSNPFLLRLAARHTVGTRTEDAVALERSLPYRYHQHEIVRWLEVAGLAGAEGELAPWLTVTAADRVAARDALAGLPRPVVALHPGATDPRRRWPARRFAELAGRLADYGAGVVVLGDRTETGLQAAVAGDRAGVRAAGTDLNGLVGVLAESDVVVANDSGPRHLAEAVGTPTVSVFWCANVINAAPFTRAAHRPHISWTVACPVCGSVLTDPAGTHCDHQDSWVADVPLAAVLADTVDLLG